MTDLSNVADSDLRGIRHLDIDDVLAYVHRDLKRLPDYTELYKRYLRQRWDVYELDFSQEVVDWREGMSQEERDAFVGISAGFHHGERQVGRSSGMGQILGGW
jgi:ribonucleoside-diphosphate reductase beta chain